MNKALFLLPAAVAFRAQSRSGAAAAPEPAGEASSKRADQACSTESERAAKEEENNALFITTSCEETPFPWQRTATASTRLAEALGSLHALPSSNFYPFDTSTAWTNSLLRVLRIVAGRIRAAACARSAAQRAHADPVGRPGPADAAVWARKQLRP